MGMKAESLVMLQPDASEKYKTSIGGNKWRKGIKKATLQKTNLVSIQATIQ